MRGASQDWQGETGDSGRVSDSLIRIELITHFHRNPGLEITLSELAEAIGREHSRVESQTKKLVQLHILDERPNNGGKRYRYVPPHTILTGGKGDRGQSDSPGAERGEGAV